MDIDPFFSYILILEESSDVRRKTMRYGRRATLITQPPLQLSTTPHRLQVHQYAATGGVKHVQNDYRTDLQDKRTILQYPACTQVADTIFPGVN